MMASCWPEQEAVWKWIAKHGIDLTFEQEKELKDAVSAYRISEVKRLTAELEASQTHVKRLQLVVLDELSAQTQAMEKDDATSDRKRTKYNVDYADRECVVCGSTYKPNHTTQMVCSTKCGNKRKWLQRKKTGSDTMTTVIFPQLLLDFVNKRNMPKFILATIGARPGIGIIRTVSSS